MRKAWPEAVEDEGAETPHLFGVFFVVVFCF